MKKLFLLFAMLCTLFSVGATTYTLHVVNGFTEFSNGNEIPLTQVNDNVYAYNGTLTASSAKFDLCVDGSGYYNKINCTADTWNLIRNENGYGQDNTIPDNTYYGVTLYVVGNHFWIYFSTNQSHPVLTKNDVGVTSPYQIWAWVVSNSNAIGENGANFKTTSVGGIYEYDLPSPYNATELTGFKLRTNNWEDQWGNTNVTTYNVNSADLLDGTGNTEFNTGVYYKYYVYYDGTNSPYAYVSSINNANVTVVPTVEQVPGTSTVVKITAPVPTELSNASLVSYVKSYTVTRNDGQTITAVNTNGVLTATDNTAVAGTTYTYNVTCNYIDCKINTTVEGPVLQTPAATTASITPVTYPSAYTTIGTDAVIGNCFKRTASVGGGEGTRNSTYLEKHYRITFPATIISWANNIPDGYTMSYSLDIKDVSGTVMRTFTGDASGDQTALTIYGGYGSKTADLSCTYTKTADNSNFTTTSTTDITYSDPSTLSRISGTQAAGKLYKNSLHALVAEVSATDGGDVTKTAASYYILKRYDGTSLSTNYSDYNVAVTPVSDNSTTTMRPFIIMFQDIIKANRGDGAITADEAATSHYYLVVPVFTMVKLPILSTELSQFLGAADTYGDRTLTLAPSTAPAIDFANVNNAKIKTSALAVTNGESLLTAQTVDVNPYEVNLENNTITETTNEHVVTYTQGTVPTGIEGVTVANVSIIGGEGMITVNGANNVAIYDTTGRLISKVAGQNQIDMPAGLYIVRADSKVAKVVVK
jgi:hypothetical protein